MLKVLFQETKSQLDFFFKTVSFDVMERVLSLAEKTQGVLLFSGVGKSGIVSTKIAATLTSTGTKALFVSPTDALHGDLGMVSQGDLFFLLSKSGQTEELISLIPAIRSKGAFPIAVVSKEKSPLASLCDDVILLPFDRELCPFDLAPTTSTLVQTIFGDAFAVALMQKKRFSMETYALNHPAGQIGKRLCLKVQDVMLPVEKVPLCQAEEKLKDVLGVMSEKKCGCLVVVNAQGRLMGIFTDGDLRRALEKYRGSILELPLKEVMTKGPRFVASTLLAYEAMQSMEENRKSPIMVLPVVDQDKVVGLLKMHDLVQSGL